MAQDYFAIRAHDAPWGDYGRTLVHGMSKRLPRSEGMIQLERCGPFVPPISVPGIGDVVVTGATRAAFEASDLVGVRFQKVILARVARWDWKEWDTTLPMPPLLPTSREPADYVLASPHDARTAAEIGDLWEIVADPWGKATSEVVRGARPRKSRILFEPGAGQAPDLFRADGLGHLFASLRGRDWLERKAGEWLTFQAVEFPFN
jgi:hypothetical protein